VLRLPGESYLADLMADRDKLVDVDALHGARERVRVHLASALHAELIDTYESQQTQGDFDIGATAIGRRSLKNLALSYLSAGESVEAERLCVEQYRAQRNMTDAIVALALIADGDMAQRQELLADFAERWAKDPLVMDKWFGVQAASHRADTLDRVRELMQHPAFSIRNPNKVRALIGGFSNGNPVRFHAADGSGYEFLADRVLELDPLNPQIAARLLRVMARWRRYDEVRQAEMKAQLERIAAAPKVSKDVYEIASKSLDAG
jgi:aminopeptidase N